ncbi:protein sidekick-like [Paramacrobiotus metropolitanus]|uniref:protein sidekick-like n=1 Tax=Paramacrobiotus metropolitanus TaxID=2943436 RepID=UPI002445C33B|nr:protein sidekick-like [Paramacrobiotus metropolitanus]
MHHIVRIHNNERRLFFGIIQTFVIVYLVVCDAVDGNEQCTAPRFSVQPHLAAPAWDSLAAGSRVILTCSATGTPPPKYRWLKDNITLNINEVLDSPDWIVHPVSSEDNGLYRCTAENPCGSVVSSAFHLALPHMSQFDPVIEATRTVNRGEAVILQPPAINSIPPAMFSWTGDGVPISPSGNHRKYVVTLNNALVILDADVGDSKHYRLEAVNRQLNQTKTSDPIGIVVNDVPVSVDSGPRFVIRPSDVTGKLGDAQAVFECIVNARPLPALRVLWRRQDGQSLQADGINYLITSNGYRMTILNPGPAFEGEYECVAEMEGFGNITAAAHLSIAASPKIVQAPDVEIHADLGRSLTIPCGAHGKPAPRVTWYKNALQITPDSMTPLQLNSKFNLLDNGSLEMAKIEDGDGGIYQCFVRNAVGEESSSTLLRIKRSITVDTTIPVITVVENQSAQLNCPGIMPASKTEVAWYFKGAAVVSSGSNYGLDETGSLSIPFASKSMEGNYFCISGRSDSMTNRSVTLVVIERTRITDPPRDTKLIIGSKVVFHCGINKNSNTTLDIQWLQDGKLLDPATLTSRRQILKNGNLIINSARNSDIGLYTCRVYSSAGNDSQSARLDVIELPYAPHVRAELINGTKSVNISWLPDFDGNSPITRFILQYKQFTSSSDSATALTDMDWQTLLSNFSATDRFYIVKDLRPSASYQFRVSAVNNVGEGASSAPSQPIELPQTPPSSPPKVAASPRNATAIMIQWQPPAETDWNGPLLGYTIRYKLAGYSELSWTEVALNEEGRRNYMLEDLIPWKMYEIQMAACNNKGTGIWSDSVRVKTQEGVPEAAPTDVVATPLSSTSLSVSWKPPDPQHINGVNQGYRVEVWLRPVNTSGGAIKKIEVAPSPYDPSERLSTVVDSLDKYTAYSVTVLCFTGAGSGPKSIAVPVTTMEDTPGPVHNLHVFDIRDRSIKLSWNIPEHPNGIVTDFVIECGQFEMETNATINVQKFRLEGWRRSFTIESLQPQTNYALKVLAETKVGAGEVRVVRIRSSMPPTLPCPPSNLVITSVEAKKAVVQFDPGCDGNTSILQINVDIQTRDMKADEWKRLLEVTENTSNPMVQLEKLGPSVEYRIRLSVDNVVGQSAPSRPSDWFQTLADSPSNPPGNLTLRAINATAIRARWTPLVTDQWNGKTGSYLLVFRSLNDTPVTQSMRNVVVNDSSVGSLVLANLEEFTQYEVRIAAVNAIGSSDQSTPVLESTRESVPSQSPSNILVHAIGSSKIVVQWGNISAVHHNGILLGYNIYYASGPDQRVLNIGDPNIHHATLYDLDKYTEYSIQVAGVTRMGAGSRSVPIIEKTLEDYPDQPYKVTFPDVSETQVRMAWEPPLHSNGRILGYRVSYRQEELAVDSAPLFLSPELNSFTVHNLLPRSSYLFTLAANTSVGWGPAIELLVKTQLQREFPERPGKPTVSVSMVQSKALSISWLPGRQDDAAPVRYYRIQFAQAGSDVWNSVNERVEGRITSFSVRGLLPNTGYRFCVQAINDLGVSEWSDQSDVAKTAEDVPESAPTGVTATPYTTSSLTISWKAPISGLNGDLLGYVLQFHRLQPGVFGGSIPFEEVIVKQNATTYNLTDLARDSTYEVRIAAATRPGRGPFTPIVAAFVGEAVPLIRPTDVIVGVSSPSAVSVSWHAPVGVLDQSVTGYKVFYMDTVTSEEHTDFVPPSSNRHQIRSLRPFRTYTISIAIFNSAGDGPRAGGVNATTLESTPDPPQKVWLAGIQLTQLTVMWEQPQRTNGIIRGYEVLCRPLAVEKAARNFTTAATDRSLTITDLEEGLAYIISVRAETGRGFGNWSSANVTVGPQTGSPAKPTDLAVQMSESSVNMRWVNSDKGQAPILGYLIQGRKESGSWDTLETLNDGLADFHQLSYLKLLPGTRYRFRVASYNNLGISYASEPSVVIQTPNHVVEIARNRPFYMEVWFLILVAAVGSVFVILLIACLCIKSKTAKYRQEVEKVTSTADMLQFPEDDEFAAPTAFELRQSMRRSARKLPPNNNIYSTSTTNSLKRKTTSASTARPPPFIIAAPPTGIVPSIAYSDIGDTSDIYPPHINRGYVNEGSASASRASSSLTEKPSEMHESSTDEVDDGSAEGENRLEGDPDEQSSSFVNHYANLTSTLRRPWLAEGAGTSERRLPPRMMEEPPRPPYRRSTATSISASIADSDSTSASLNGHLLLNITNKPGSRNPLPGFSSFV